MTDARRIILDMSEQREPGEVPAWTLGWRLKRSLSWADVAANEMAEYLGYSNAQISRYLNDKGKPPPIRVLRLWSMRCGLPLEWLQSGTVANGPDDGPGQEIHASGCNDATAGRIIPLRRVELAAA